MKLPKLGTLRLGFHLIVRGKRGVGETTIFKDFSLFG